MIPLNPAVVEVIIDSVVELSDAEKKVIISKTRDLFETTLKFKVINLKIKDKTYG